MDPNNKPKQLNSPFVTTVMKYAGSAHAWVYRKSGGKIGANWRVGAGVKKPVPTLLLEHTGRKSGKAFVSPLVFINDGDDVIMVASKGGRDTNPQWYRNLVADPDVHIEIGTRPAGRARRGRRPRGEGAALAETGRGLRRLRHVQSWTDRDIPVFILKPR